MTDKTQKIEPLESETMTGVPLSELLGSERSVGLYFSLTVIEGKDFGFIIQIDDTETLIGRKEENNNDVTIQIDEITASRRHLILLKKAFEGINNSSHVFAIDLGSKNGTYVNNERLIPRQETELRNGDKISIGETVLKFEIRDRLELSYQKRLYEQITQDALTKLHNLSYARQEIQKSLSVAARNQFPISLLLVEIDFFQNLGENYGNAVTDSVLRMCAQSITNQLNTYQMASRFSDHQFLIFLPEAEVNGATNIAEQLRISIEKTDFSIVGCSQRVTISIGIAQFPICGQSFDELITKASDALFQAQEIGRNRVEVAKIIETKKNTVSLKKIAGVFAILLLVATIGVASKYAYDTYYVSTDKSLHFSGIVETHEVEVGSNLGGRVTEVLVKEGQTVKKGQALVRFNSLELAAQSNIIQGRILQAKASLTKLQNGRMPEEIEEAEAAMRRAQALLEDLRSGNRPQELAQVEADILAAKVELSNAESIFKRNNTLYSSGTISKQDHEQAEVRRDVALARLESLKQKLALLQVGSRSDQIKAAEEAYKQATANVKVLKKGSRQEDIEAAKGRLMEAEGELERLNAQLVETELVAASDSYVEVVNVRPGNLVPSGKPIIRLIEQDQTWAKVYVPETELGHIYIGQKASITVDTYPDRVFSGHITQISEQAEFTPRNIQTRNGRSYQVFGVKIELDKKEDAIKAGMAVEAKVLPK